MEITSSNAGRGSFALLALGAAGSLAALSMARLLQSALPDHDLVPLLSVAALGPGVGATLARRLPPPAGGSRGWLAGVGLVLGAALVAPLLAVSGAAGTWAAGGLLAIAFAPLGLLAASGDDARMALAWGAAGAGLGAVTAVLPAATLPPAESLLIAGALASLGGSIARAGRALPGVAVAAALLACLLVPGLAGSVVRDMQAAPPHGQLANGAAARAGNGERIVYDGWDALGRTQLVELMPGVGALLQDGGAATPWLAGSSSASGRASTLERVCESTLQAIPHFRPRHRVAVLGAGGALDAQCALHHGAARVDWVIGRPALADLARAHRKRLGLGAPTTIIDRAPRAFLSGHEGGYDMIAVPGASARHPTPFPLLPPTTGFPITEQSLATALAALAPNGVLAIGAIGEPDALSTILTALAALGPGRPGAHLVVAQGGGAYSIVVRRMPVPMDEIVGIRNREAGAPIPLSPELIRAMPWSLGPVPIVRYTPVVPRKNRIQAFMARLQRGESQTFERSYSFAVGAAHDDRPRLNDHGAYAALSRWSVGTPIVRLLWQGAGLAMLAWLLMWLIGRTSSDALANEPNTPDRRPSAGFALACAGATLPLTFSFASQHLAAAAAFPAQGFALASLALAGSVATGALLSRRAPPLALTCGIAGTLVALVAVALPMLHSAGLLIGSGALCASMAGLVAAPGVAVGAGIVRLFDQTGARRAWAPLLMGAGAASPWPSMAVGLSGYAAAQLLAAALWLLAAAVAFAHQRST